MLELFAVLSNVYIAIDQRQRMLHSLGILEQGFILLGSAEILTNTIQTADNFSRTSSWLSPVLTSIS